MFKNRNTLVSSSSMGGKKWYDEGKMITILIYLSKNLPQIAAVTLHMASSMVNLTVLFSSKCLKNIISQVKLLTSCHPRNLVFIYHEQTFSTLNIVNTQLITLTTLSTADVKGLWTISFLVKSMQCLETSAWIKFLRNTLD